LQNKKSFEKNFQKIFKNKENFDFSKQVFKLKFENLKEHFAEKEKKQKKKAGIEEIENSLQQMSN
jgi:hypothetical protein